MTAVILRALDALSESDPAPASTAPDLPALIRRIEALERLIGHPPKRTDRAAILERIATLRAAGQGSVRIARLFNREGVPTLSGRGRWQPGTIDKLHPPAAPES
jgi:hypothetical protein